jgi:hypothetical protein
VKRFVKRESSQAEGVANMREKLYVLVLLVATFSTVPLYSQAPMPIVTPAVTKAAPQTPAATTATTSDAPANNLRTLRDLKAANEETIRKQKAALDKLDELQKSADQIKLYAKRS